MIKEHDQSKQKKMENGDEVDKEFNYIKSIVNMNYDQERKFKAEVRKLTDDCLNESCTSSWSSNST